LLIKQEKFVLKILLVALTDGVLAMAHNNTLLKTGPIPKEIQQTASGISSCQKFSSIGIFRCINGFKY